MCADVVGRDAELRTITRFLDSLVAQPQALVLEGEPGIGKTTLWLAALDQARQRGFRVLSCRPSAAEAHLSYASLADVLADVGDAVLEILPEPQRRAIDFVLLRTKAGPAVTDHRAAGAALLSILDRLADAMLRPILISSLLLAWTGRLDQARETLLSIRRRCLERGEESDLMFTAFHAVIVECWRGNLADARLIAEDTLQRALQLGSDFPLAIALATQANVAAYAGLADETRRAAREALTIFERGSCLAVTVWPIVTLGFLEVSLGDYQAAAATLAPLAAAAAAIGYGEPTAAPFAAADPAGLTGGPGPSQRPPHRRVAGHDRRFEGVAAAAGAGTG